jgi:hypothetical protein
MRTISIDLDVKNSNNIIDRNNQVEITFEAQPEDIRPDFEEPFLSDFLETLKNDQDYQYGHDTPNWFCAKVTVKHLRTGFEATDYLGGCSYKSYDEFVKTPNDYFAQMVDTCVDEINEMIDSINEKTKANWRMRREFINNGLYDYFLYNLKSLKQY